VNKIAIINDTHFGVRNDSSFFLEKCLSYFENVVFPYIKENNITNMIHLGDFFDRRKYINFNTLSEVRRRFLEKIPKDVHFHIILGNHDTFYKNTNEVNSLKELFRGYSNITLYDTPSTIDINNLKISLIPWINDTNKIEYYDYIQTCNSPILMGHFEIIGFEVIDGVKHHSGITESAFNKFEMVLSGHFHIKQSKRNIHYLGTQYQMNFGDANTLKGFHILDTNTRELEFIENIDNIFNIIYYDDSSVIENLLETDLNKYSKSFLKVIVKHKNKPLIFEKYINTLYSLDTQELMIIDDYSEKIQNSLVDITEDTVSIINKEIDGLENDLNKDKLKLIIKDLYMEALSI
jgi:3',5'-cyclic AMP phosphodiesterase CpdA